MINLLFVGDTQVGKSSLIERFCRNSYSESYSETKSVENIKKTIEHNDLSLELQIFDASGKPENRKALKEYYEKVSGVLLVFSLTDRSSFNSVKKWVDTLQKNLSSAIPIVLVGNKQDVGEKIVSPEDINQVIEEYKLKYFEVSAKENIRVSELFTSLVTQIKSGQSGRGTPRHQLSRQNSSGTPRKLILQSFQSFGDASQTVLTQKIQEQMALLKVELLESIEDQRKKELENMENKIQTLEKQLQSSQESIAKEIELKTSSYINELKEENRSLVLKMTQLENNLGNKAAALLEQGNLEECHDKNSVYYHDSSVHESEGKFLHADFAKQFEDEIHEIKRRLNETDIRLIQTLRHVDTKHLELMKEVNHKAGGTLTDAELLAIGEKFTEPPQSTEDLPPVALKPRTSSQKNKIGRVKAYSNFALSVNTHGKTGSTSHRRKFSALDGGDNAAEPKFGQDYINSETIIRGENQVSPAVTQPHPTSIFIYNEENNYGHPQDSEHYNHSNLHLGNLSETKIDDGHHEINSGFRVEEGFRNIEEEITLIWKTINTIIENAQDQISRLRTEYSPTTNQAQKGDDQEPISMSEFRNDETPVDLLKKEYISVNEEPKTPMKNAQPEKDLKTTLIELKDDVHNQILGVQREFEKELLGLKDILMGHYSNFSGKMEQENDALKDYIDGKIEELSVDIDKVLMNYEPEIVRSTRSMSEGKIIRSSTQSKEAVFDHLEVAPVINNTNNGSIVDLKDYVTETKLKEVQDMQEELGKSIWETISLMANRLAQVEQDVVTKIIQQAQKKV